VEVQVREFCIGDVSFSFGVWKSWKTEALDSDQCHCHAIYLTDNYPFLLCQREFNRGV
jgi:hypothetical protein